MEGKDTKIPIWEKYGLSCNPKSCMIFIPDTGTELEYRNFFNPLNVDPRMINSIRAHWLVIWYLENYSEAVVKYKSDQSGELRYYDVMSLAEKESGIHVYYNDFIE